MGCQGPVRGAPGRSPEIARPGFQTGLCQFGIPSSGPPGPTVTGARELSRAPSAAPGAPRPYPSGGLLASLGVRLTPHLSRREGRAVGRRRDCDVPLGDPPLWGGLGGAGSWTPLPRAAYWRVPPAGGRLVQAARRRKGIRPLLAGGLVSPVSSPLRAWTSMPPISATPVRGNAARFRAGPPGKTSKFAGTGNFQSRRHWKSRCRA